jgi:hypothetical protein
LPQGHDWLLGLVRAAEYGHALAEGQLPPRWAPDLYGGFGSPIFHFYAPLFSAATAGIAWLGSGVARAASMVLIAAGGIAALGAHRLLREASPAAPPGAARVAAIVYVLHPYLLCDALARNANAEYLALALAPLPLSGMLAAARSPRAAVLRIAIGLALVVLAHNLTALWVAAMLAGGALLAHGRGERARCLLACAAGIGLGLALSAGFWLPALALEGEVRSEALLEGKFDFRRQFAPLGSVFGYRHFYAIGLLTPLLWAAAWTALALGRPGGRERRLLALALGASAALLCLLLPVSTPLWERLPYLRYFQFPWRFLGPLALLAALSAGLAFAVLASRLPAAGRAAAEAAVLALCVANALPGWLDARPLPQRVRERLPELLRPESIARNGLSATVGDEYLPRAADPRAWRDGLPTGPVAGRSGAVEARAVRDHGAHVELALRAEGAGVLELRRFAFPGWRVTVDGRPLEPGISARGALLVPIEAGARRLEARLEPVGLVRGARGISALAALVWLALLLAPRARGARA